MDANTQKETLDRILASLKSDENLALAAIAELGGLNFSSPAIVEQLERLALHKDDGLREAALRALDLPSSIFVTAQLSSLTTPLRKAIVEEIGIWRDDGLVEEYRAEVLRRRYDFDSRKRIVPQTAATAEPAAPAVQPQQQPATQSPAHSVTPKQSLTQVVLSESAVKIYLYLGAFFVITAAAILAALVEAARLPVLLIATLLFAGGAVALKKRLPQPSFALSIVFSFLLPIDANVLADSLGLVTRVNEIYWTVVFLGMAFIWALGTWFYQSRLFSVAAYVSLGLAALRFSAIFEASTNWSVFAAALANMVTLAGVYLLKRWKDQNFAMPLFALAQFIQLTLLAVTFISTLIGQFDQTADTSMWIASALTWMLAASFYIASDIIIPFLFFPWMAVASTFLLPWLVLSAFNASAPLMVIGFAGWALVHALSSEIVQRTNRPAWTKYHHPLVAWSLPLFLVAVIAGFAEGVWYGFGTFACAALTYTLIHFVRPRWYVWLAALFAGLGTYFTFFALPFMENVSVASGYQLLGASLLLLVPELLAKGDFKFSSAWRWPPVVLGVAISTFSLIARLGANASQFAITAIVFGVHALLAAAYAVHLKRPLIGYIATTFAAITAIYILRHFDRDWWLPTLTAISAAYYVASFLFRGESGKPWSAVLANSGLALGGIISLLAMIVSEAFGGWYALAIAAMFIVEMYARKNTWLEFFAIALMSISLLQILSQFKVYTEAYRFFGLGLLWPISDMIFKFTIQGRKLESITKIAAGLLAFTSTFLLITGLASVNAAICLAVFTLVAVAYVWVHKNPLLGYIPALLFAFTVYFAGKAAGLTAWVFPQIAVALLYYAAGFFLRRTERAPSWASTPLFSGLGLGTFVAVVSPFQVGGLENAIPIAIAATFYAAEAFARRNVWLGFPANALYLTSYFVILNELKVDEPQFFSVGAAALGLFQHYLLMRAGHKTTAFITGLVSQLVLLGTTYVQMIDTSELKYFFVLFFQALAVLGYGIVVRSRSLILAPIAFVVLAIFTILYNALKDLSLVFIIGIAGLILLGLGILAVIMRERITDMADRFSDWNA